MSHDPNAGRCLCPDCARADAYERELREAYARIRELEARLAELEARK